ncbi:phytoene desaturase family protein [Palleronia abyssalis]|uniref:Diapolycopene oxygenase n=1 Tax=Palleronia abyssalis TaxID=1501240 RepID=A0A2R8BYP0_9RHOB|nr:phytoene desaturase family protein [Palleronia abyssalis]SPJ25295.1 Diapolycopene oxygenase [Palleronia abyssalis]
MSSVAIIGGGLGGLAAAATLAARGHDVTVLEKNNWLGGKAAELKEDGFRFDMGPTILTMPRVLERVFAEAGRDMSDYLDLRRLDPQWRCFYDDGTVLDLRNDPKEAAREIGKLSAGDEQGFQRFMEVADRLSDVSDRFFFWKSVEDIRDTMNLKANMNLTTLSDVMALRMHRTVAGQIKRDVKDKRVQQMLEHFIQYIGSSPLASPAVLCGIAQMQQDEGVWYPMGGTRAVPTALTRLGEELGVDYRTGVDVSKIEVENGHAVAVVANGERLRFDKVVSNMDSVRTYRELVGGKAWQGFGYKNREAACSGIVLYLGLDRAYEHLAHHNFVFSRDPAEEFKAIYDDGVPAPDPTAYIAAPSRTEPGVAPAGGEALYILVHTPHLRPGQDWSQMLPAERAKIMDKLSRAAGMEDLQDRIVVERSLTPQDIHDRYRVLDGAIYGLVSHGRVNGAFKPGNRSREVRDLYLAGGSAHPGAGMPMALMSGWIAADSLHQDATRNAPMVAE